MIDVRDVAEAHIFALSGQDFLMVPVQSSPADSPQKIRERRWYGPVDVSLAGKGDDFIG